MIAVCHIQGSTILFVTCLWRPTLLRSQDTMTAGYLASRKSLLASHRRHPRRSERACMPAWFLPQVTGSAGSLRTFQRILLVGMARELAELRLSIRWVLTSARIHRGKVHSTVVSRFPAGLTLSAMTLALITLPLCP